MAWDYTKINQETPQQPTILGLNRRTLRLLKESIKTVPGVTVRYSCDGLTAGVSGDGVDRLTTDVDLQYGNGATPRSWIVLRYANMANVETLLSFTDDVLAADLTLGQLRFTAVAAGAAGNAVRVVMLGDSPSGVTFSEAGNIITIRYQTGVSTPATVVAALATATLVTVVALGATVLTAPGSDTLGQRSLNGGHDTQGLAVAMSASFGAAYTGGTITALPTSADSQPGPAFVLSAANLGTVFHVINSTTGDDVRMLIHATLEALPLDFGFVTDTVVGSIVDLGSTVDGTVEGIDLGVV
jgi:hypothetical protein